MKHTKKVTIAILILFLIAQFIGLFVINAYATQKVVDGQVVKVNATKTLPYGLDVPEAEQENIDYVSRLLSFLISFAIAFTLIFLLVKLKSKFVMRTWFFVVGSIALGVSFTAIFPEFKYVSLVALAIAIPLGYFKIYRRDNVVHNLTELFIYPGIAAIFVPLLSITSIIILLFIISVYDAWAVWKVGIMQKMAKYQMEELNIFGGLLIPYATKKMKEKIKRFKEKIKNKKLKGKQIEKLAKKEKIRIDVAVLGGGDIVFPIITSGVVMLYWGLVPALIVTFGAFLGLAGLLFNSKKKKSYPAMPFITAGIILGMVIDWLIFVL